MRSTTTSLFAAMLAAAAIAAAQDAPPSEAPAGADLAPAMRAATEWLDDVDRGAYGRSWDRAADLFRETIPRVKWEAAAQSVREGLGAVVRRKLLSATYATSLPGAPPGEYVVIQYSTTFARRSLAVETVTPMRGRDGSWKVSAYSIR